MTIIARDITLYSCFGNVYILWDIVYVLRENLSIKKCTTVFLECVAVVSFCPPPSTSARLWNFFSCDVKKH